MELLLFHHILVVSHIQYKIKSKTDKNILKYNPSEDEVIFKRNTKFKVL